MVESVRVHDIDSSVGELKVMKVSDHYVAVVAPRVEIDSDGERTLFHERANFGALPRRKAEHASACKRRTVLVQSIAEGREEPRIVAANGFGAVRVELEALVLAVRLVVVVGPALESGF